MATELEPPPATSRRRLDVRRIVISLLVVGAFALIAFGFASAQTGDPTKKITDPAIETVYPLPDALVVPPQSQIVADLAPGYRGELVLDGQLLSSQDLTPAPVDPNNPPTQPLPAGSADAVFDAANGTITFSPRAGTSADAQLVDGRLRGGRHTVTVRFWPMQQSASEARSFTWSFNVNA